MGRKPATRTASAAAAAANAGGAPTFTSFAAATAQVLEGYSSSATVATEQHEWDSTALQLLKKLSKRDATTKEKALTDLSEHMKFLPAEPGVGTAFITAWGEAFRTVIEDPSPGVRVAALTLMGDTVQAFRRGVQHIFPSILPLWLAAKGDFNVSVSSAASSSLERVLPTDERRKKVFSRYAEELRTYCLETISQIGSSDSFLADAKRVIAVLRWLLDASQTTSSIASIIDAEPHPLLLFAKGRKKKRESESALRDVCDLAVFILSFMESSRAEDQSRAAHFADIAVHAIRKAETSGWDLTIVLLRDGWSSSFGPDLGKLSTVVCESVASPVPTGVQALLPLFESLPHEDVSSSFVEKVLVSMREYLHPSSKKKKAVQITVSYALTALLSYIQAASYAQRVLVKRWYGKDEGKTFAFASKIFEEHVIPTCRLFVSGVLPPVSKQAGESVVSRRRNTAKGSDKNIAEISRAFGHVLRVMDDSVSSQVISDITKGFGSSLSDHSPEERLQRFEYLIDVIEHEARENQLVMASVMAIIQNKQIKPEVAFEALATLLSTRAARRLALLKETSIRNNALLMSELREYFILLLRQETVDKEQLICSNVEEIARVFSWIYTASVCLDCGESWSLMVMDLRSMFSEEIEYTIIAETIFAQKRQRELFDDMAWIPVMGNDLDNMTITAVNNLLEQEIPDSAIRFICAAVDIGGGAKVSQTSRKQIVMKIIKALRDDKVDEKMDPVIEALLFFTRPELGLDYVCQSFVSSSVARGVKNLPILEQIIYYIKSCPSEHLLELSESMGEVIIQCLLQAKNSQQSQIIVSVSDLISAFGEYEDNVSNLLCRRLFACSSPICISGLLGKTPFKFVFGDGVRYEVDVEFLNEAIVKAYTHPHEELDVGLETYLANLCQGERLRIGANATRSLLSNPRKGTEKIISYLSETAGDFCAEEFSVISEELKQFWVVEDTPNVSRSKELSGVIAIVRICSVQTHGKCVSEFRPFLDHIVSFGLEDVLATETFWAIEALTASLYGFTTSRSRNHGRNQPPSWLQMIVLKALQYGREELERLSFPDVEAEKNLESSLANLLRVSIQCFRFEASTHRELTFWASRICDVFQRFVSKPIEEHSPGDIRRLCFFTGLSEAIVTEVEEGILGFEVTEKLIYLAAWISVILIPYLEKNNGTNNASVDARSCSRWCADSILAAAEMRALLREDGDMPVPTNTVYSLIPNLNSSLAVVRKAILTLVVHAATADLTDRVAHTFPTEGFANEDGERAFVESIIPYQLREALEWSGVINTLEGTNHELLISHEVGYFLAWRIFLDLLRPDDLIRVRTTANDTEDLSFRRVGLSYLEERPHVYKSFFKRCIDIVIDGTMVERQSARKAAVMAIQTEENAAIGVIMAKSGHSSKTEKIMTVREDTARDYYFDGNCEEAVGHAAGIAFARALQRLPALSRETVTHDLERGAASRVEAFVRSNLAPLLIAAEVRKVKQWGEDTGGPAAEDGEGELTARGSVAGREVWATYHFSDVALEIGMRIPDVFPLQTATVEARSRIGMSEAQWRKTLLGMATLLRAKNGSLAEALALWRRNLDKTFQGAEECPICYSVLHVATAALPKKACRTCRNSFHSDCLLRWFSTSNTCACPTCRSVF